jgi:hypothetical protein
MDPSADRECRLRLRSSLLLSQKTARLFVQAGGRIDVGSYGGIKPGVEIGAGLR